MKSLSIRIFGIVQGVGFRPFIWRIAKESGLSGFVRNESFGVVVRIQGNENAIDEFIKALHNKKPSAARIDRIEKDELPYDESIYNFTIEKSLHSHDIGLMPHDLAVCEDCLGEMFEPDNCRYLYPFINCTNCGPRFTIVKNLPYDRPSTTMVQFTMCSDCRDEYENPGDRRYHAQPIACPACGPAYNDAAPGSDDESYIGKPQYAIPLIKAAQMLANGEIIAVQGIGGFHIMCDARNDETIARLRKWKNRPTKPFALMARNIEITDSFVHTSEFEKECLKSSRAPILLLEKRSDSDISSLVAPGLTHQGVFMPYAPVHHILFEFGAPDVLIATSGNRRDEPIVKNPDDASEKLDIADCVFWHNRPIHNRIDDSVGFTLNKKIILTRRARGFVPERYELPRKFRKILAAGADMKGGIAVCDGSFIYPSQYLGELIDPLAQDFWCETVDKFLQWLQVEPEFVVCDLHPDYFSTRLAGKFAEKEGIPIMKIQHHKAHAWGVVAEHNITEKAVAAIFDGTGLGEDKSIWGGEFFIVEPEGGLCERVGHLRRIVLPGGDSAAIKITRMALVYLLQAFGTIDKIPKLALMDKITPLETEAIERIYIEHRKPITTSAGRFFDAIAAIIGVAFENEYEAQAPMLLETTAQRLTKQTILSNPLYEFKIYEENEMIKLDFSEMVRQICEDVSYNLDNSIISAKFHRTVARSISQTLLQLADEHDAKLALLSGGVFQNRLLLELVAKELDGKLGFKIPECNPANDQGIALGQALWGTYQ